MKIQGRNDLKNKMTSSKLRDNFEFSNICSNIIAKAKKKVWYRNSKQAGI
jgi:hypothetical protein